MVYWVYNAEWTLGFILSLPMLPLFLALGRRFREGFFQRFGFYPRKLRESVRGVRPIWIDRKSVV